MITPNGGVFGRNPKFNNVTVDGNLTVNGDIALGDDIVVTDTLTVNGITTVANTTDSTTKDNGALVVEGGVGIEKALTVGGQIRATSTTASTSTITGSAVISGGLGVAGAIYPGGNVVMANGNGISFAAHPHATGMTSELLDDYEVGTWTVELYDAQTGGNVSPTTTTGYYTKVGNLVTAAFFIVDISTTGMTAGNAIFVTLPITPSGAPGYCAGAASVSDVTFPAGTTYITPVTTGGVARFTIRASGSATGFANLAVSALSTGVSDLSRVTISYFA